MSPFRTAAVCLAAAVLAGSLLLTLCRVWGPVNRLGVSLAAFATFAVLGYALAALALALLRRGAEGNARTVLTSALVLSLLGLALHAYWLAPSFVGDKPHGAANLTVVQFNMKVGQGDARETVELVRRNQADVLVLEEVTPGAVQRLQAAGLGELLPYSAPTTLPGWPQTLAFSRHPLTDVQPVVGATGLFQMRVGGPHPVTLFPVHVTMALINVKEWASDLSALRAASAALTGPGILVGDFNATLDNKQLRNFEGVGLHDAATQARTGWQPTWPSTGSASTWSFIPGGPSVITIDHALLTRQIAAVSVQRHVITGSDHQALVLRLRVS